MKTLLSGPGFLGTKATFGPDASLVMMLLAAGLFTLGWRLAVGKKHTGHHWVQTVATALNAIPVLVLMISSFATYILPGIPSKLNEGTYGITTIHAFVGMITFVLGVFVTLRANGLVPRSLRFGNYKLFMRTSYALYMLATLIGVVVYVQVYTGG